MTTLIKDKATFDKACDSIAKRGAKLDAEIQHLGLSALAHVDEHKNPHFINKLYLSLHAGARKSAMTAWLLAHGKVQANAGDNKKELPFVLDKERTTDMAGAAANPWYDFKPDAAPDEVFDVVAAVRAIIKKAGKAKNVDASHLLKLENFAADLEQGVDTSNADTRPMAEATDPLAV